MEWWPIILGLIFAAGIVIVGFLAKDEEVDAGPSGNMHPAARIQQYREWKSQASTYAEMDEWNDAIDEARKDLGKRRWP